MFKHVLVPTDGSKLAAKGVKAGIDLARTLGAKVTGVYVIQPYTPPLYGEAAIYYAGISPQDYIKAARSAGHKALEAIEAEAARAKVPCKTMVVSEARPWEGIVKTARTRKCDVVVMASHGRGGVGGLLLGSATQGVLAHSKIPVIVIR